MEELSLYILDIAMNSVRAGADAVFLLLAEEGEWLTLTVRDNGCGMSPEQVARVTDPFFTTRITRKVGLGVPFLAMLAQMTGGSVSVSSRPASEGSGHGTEVTAVLGRHHIDFVPLGDMASTFAALVQGSPRVRFVLEHTAEGGCVRMDTNELHAALGEEISLAEPEILAFIGESLREQYQSLRQSTKGKDTTK